jgi:beta-lactamase regulating signal transducer with metallopeptidase domain
MQLLFMQELFTDQAALAICWTLIHSLWQGLLFMLMAAIVMMLTVKSRPSVRYNILSLQFLLFVITAVATFLREWNMQGPGNGLASVENLTIAPFFGETGPVIFTHAGGKNRFFLNAATDFLSAHASLVATVWLIVLSLKIIKIITTLIYTQHIRNNKVQEPDAHWNDLIIRRCAQLRISKPVRLLESEMMKIPAVFGHMKPAIFVPLGMLANLPPRHVEAILMHELAHIQRGDYLMNLLQNIAESIFFFNPAVRWMSSLIREERENCCDDLAIGLTQDKTQFIGSLISFRTLSVFNHSKYLTAFPGSRNQLLNRVTRIVHNKNKTLNPMENIFLAASLMLCGFLTVAFSKNDETRPAKPLQPSESVAPAPVSGTVKTVSRVKPVTVIPAIAWDTLPEGNKVAPVNGQSAAGDVVIISNMSEGVTSKNGKETTVAEVRNDTYKIIKVDGSVVGIYVNGSEIPQNKMGEYKGVINKINGQLDKMRAEQKVRNKAQAKKNAEQAVRNQEQQKRNAEQAERNEAQAKRNAEQVVRDKEQEKMNAEQAERNEEQAKRNAEQVVRDKEQEKMNAEQAERNEAQVKMNAEQVIRNKEQEQRNAELANLINDLVSGNIIKDSKSLKSFSLNGAELIVNGQKQSSAVHEKFKNKYLKSSTDEINFRNF